MFEFKHPKYYKELRKLRNKSDQAISEQASTEVSSVRPDPGLKQQASSDKHQAEESRPVRPSAKHQAPSVKRQADIKNPG
jgi:hypothetical protein